MRQPQIKSAAGSGLPKERTSLVAAAGSAGSPKTAREDWENSDQSVPSALFWSPFDPAFAQVLKTLDQYINYGADVFEIGFAPGKVLAWAALCKGASISGVDYSRSCFKTAMRYTRDLGIEADLRNEDVFQSTFPRHSFDAVYSVGVIEHFDEPKAILQAHLDLAKINGLVVMFKPNYGSFFGEDFRLCRASTNLQRTTLQ